MAGYFNSDRMDVNSGRFSGDSNMADREGMKGKEPKEAKAGEKKGMLSAKEHFGKKEGKKHSRKSSRK